MRTEQRFIASVFLLTILLLSCVSALDLSVEKTDITPVVISEMKDPAVFEFTIHNNGAAEKVEIYSLVGVTFEPSEMFNLPQGASTLVVKAFPGQSAMEREGPYAFEYEIKGTGSDIFKDKLAIEIVKLGNVLQIEPRSISYSDKNAVINVRNVKNIPIENASLSMKSVFFDGGRIISLDPFESIDITLPIKTDGTKDLAAGSYVVDSSLEMEGVTAKVKSTVSYAEQKNIVMKKESSGWIIRDTLITKTNDGNLAVPDRIDVTKNILTRLFTSFSVEPLSTERRGLLVYYRWEKDLKPAESWSVEVKTNYTLPFVLIVIVIFCAGAVYLYSRTSLVLKKRCSFVRTRGGEFALKIMINIKARKALDNIEIFDRIPMATKLYEKAGMPHKFEESIRRLSWKIDRLNAGEERIFSYIIYSHLRIVGRLELPPATAHFIKDGKQQHVSSNRTYFVSEIHPRY